MNTWFNEAAALPDEWIDHLMTDGLVTIDAFKGFAHPIFGSDCKYLGKATADDLVRMSNPEASGEALYQFKGINPLSDSRKKPLARHIESCFITPKTPHSTVLLASS